MTDLFDKAVNTTLGHEGGYGNDPDDRGGKTNFGISQKAYPDLDIKALTRDQAIEIYRRDYWIKSGASGIQYRPLAAKVFDAAVNIGVRRAAKFLQRAVRDTGAKVAADGVIGPKTLSAVNKANPYQVLHHFLHHLVDHYRRQNQPKYLRGWVDRAFHVAWEI